MCVIFDTPEDHIRVALCLRSFKGGNICALLVSFVCVRRAFALRKVHVSSESQSKETENVKKKKSEKKIVTGDSHPVPDGSTKPAHSRLTTRV